MVLDNMVAHTGRELFTFPVIVSIFSFVTLCVLVVHYFVAYRRTVEYVDYYRKVIMPAVDMVHVYQEFVELTTDICIRYDRMGVCTYVNPAMVEMSGVRFSKMAGKRSDEFTMLDDAAAFNETVCKVIGSGESREFEAGIISKSGRINVIHVRLVPERTVTGSLNGVIAIGESLLSHKYQATARGYRFEGNRSESGV